MITCLRALSMIAVFGAVGCQDYLFEVKFPEKIRESQIVRAAAEPTPADILFVVDNSGSMADEQDRLARNFDAFINQIAGAGDYQIAVISTDGRSGMPGEQQGLLISTFNQSDPFNLTNLDNSGCTSAGIPFGCFRGPDAAKRIVSSERLPDRNAQITAFQANVLLGSCGSGEEQGLASMVRALENTGPGECNEGFLRQDANLVVIIVSDEEDADGRLVEEHVMAMRQFKAHLDNPYAAIRVAMVVGSVDGGATNCRVPATNQCGSRCQNLPPEGSRTTCTNSNQCPGGEFCDSSMRCENQARQYADFCYWCSYYNDPDCCSALGGSRYVDFARKMEARINAALPSIPIQQCRGTEEGQPIACLIDSICQDDFSATLSRIARELVINNRYTLDPPAINPEGVVVRVKKGRFGDDGKQLIYGTDFSITDMGRTLIIMGENTPREGEDVEIYYVIEVAKE